ncbi:MAG: hypothetical protein ACO28L_04660 [Candidatus Fonsibacter ubiquis]
MKITRTHLDEKLKNNLSSKFSRFIYTIHAIEHLCEETFAELYETKQGFKFSIDDSGAKIPLNKSDGYIQGSEFNSHFNGVKIHKPTPVEYKMYVDDGSIPDLKSRSIRILFINNLIKKVKSYTNLMRYGLKNGYVQFQSQSNGGKPRIEIQIKYDKMVLNKKTGKREKKDISIILKLFLKSNSDKTEKDEKPFSKFKPKQVPRLLGNKLSSKNFKLLVEKYIESQNISTRSKQVFLKAIDHAYNSTNLKVPSLGAKDFSSELFEVLSPLKLARNIELKNASFLKANLGWNDEQIQLIEPSYIRIFLPTASNEALMDYEIFYNRQNSIKVSVKSRLSSNPATVKFNTVFDDESEVQGWFDNLNNKIKNSKSAVGQKIVAKTAMEYDAKGGGRTTLYPIKALYNLLNDGKLASSAWRDVKQELEIPSGMNLNTFKTILKKVDAKVHTSSVSERHDPIDGIFNLTPEELKFAKLLIAYNIPFNNPRQKSKYIDFAERNVISKKIQTIIKGKVKTRYDVSEDHDLAEKRYPFALNNFGYLCEKAVVRCSKNNGSSKINFWLLFYDNVLSKKKILYSVMYEKLSASGLELEYKFISAVNMSKYKKWVDLRSKNNAFNLQDTLGMNP